MFFVNVAELSSKCLEKSQNIKEFSSERPFIQDVKLEGRGELPWGVTGPQWRCSYFIFSENEEYFNIKIIYHDLKLNCKYYQVEEYEAKQSHVLFYKIG